ncbi:hypothetical protein CPB83DRAFT_891735 [Crepidotus variabilis]|uniref:Uncharacterized protein n=1 Tax=Crepidotus variabilis TaxID=179855 RepID=A0A9P6EM35_9AGAR|nr:hypothetical protein CPB83DRAFT_891735 [Crepidotus variabilis]
MSTSSPPFISNKANKAFPTELIDQIIDYNHDDRNTLLAIAAVAKQWTASSRFHLFSSIEVSYDNGRQLIQLLSSPHCTFAATIRRLDIRLVGGSQKWFGEFSKRLKQFDKVIIEALGLMGSRPTVLREEARTAAVSFYSHLRELIIGPLVMETSLEFAALVTGLSNLQSLSCAVSFQSAPSFTQAQRLHLPNSLQIVELTSPSIKSILELFDQRLSSITSLSLIFMTSGDYPYLKAFLERPNNILRALKITMDANISGVSLDTFAELGFRQLTALRVLDIQTTPCMPPPMILNILKTIPSSNLRKLKMTPCLTADIVQVDEMLSGGSRIFKHLKKVAIVGEDLTAVRQSMPRCASQNLLELR